MSLRELYQEMIIDHGRQPRNAGALTDANHEKSGHNPLCGDKLRLYVKEEAGVVKDVRFEGTGCAISIASASLMTEIIKGKSLADVDDLFNGFHQLVTVGHSDHDHLGKLAVFSGVAAFPIRVKCATLAWHTLKAALANDIHDVSTE